MVDTNPGNIRSKDLASKIGDLSPEQRELLELLMEEQGISVAELVIPPAQRNYFPEDRKIAWMPISNSQQRLWFLDQFEPNSSSYNIPAAVKLSGNLDIRVLTKALNEIIRRHESLRTTFDTYNDQPIQIIHPSLEIEVSAFKLSEAKDEFPELNLRNLVIEEATKPFNLRMGPLIRAALFILGEKEHLFLLTMHHIVSDGWSMGIFIQELMVLYDAYIHGAKSTLPDLTLQYADYAVWQKKWLESSEIRKQINYWLNQLGGSIPLLDLPSDRPRPAVMSGKGNSYSKTLSLKLVESIRNIAHENGCTQFMVLVSALYVLLHRYTGETDLTIGSPVANRNRVELENLIGMLINTIVLRNQVDGNMNFIDLLQSVKETTLAAYANQDVPFELLVEKLQPERDTSHNPLFQVMLILQNTPGQTKRLTDITMEAIEVHSGTSTFDLTISITERIEGLHISFEYNTDIFNRETIERLAGHYQMILEGLAETTDQKVSDIQFITIEERSKLLIEWNKTFTNQPQAPFVQQVIHSQANKRSNAVALRAASMQMTSQSDPSQPGWRDKYLTYGELERNSNKLANFLRKLGVGPEYPVGVFMERSLDVIVSLIGILKAGGVYVPLDPSFPQERLHYMVNDSQIQILITHRGLMDDDTQRLFFEDGIVKSTIYYDDDWEQISQETAEMPEGIGLKSSHLAYVIYTSGSTGKPKGVAITQGAIAEYCRSMVRLFGTTDADRALQFSTFNFDTSLEEIFVPLMSGAEVIVRGDDLWTAENLQRIIDTFQITYLSFTPAYWQMWTQAFADLMDKRADNSANHFIPRIVILGGDTMLGSAVKLWRSTPLKKTRLLNTYGPTEITITATSYEVPADEELEKNPAKSPIGRPHANRTAYILDPYGNLCPIGIPGELFLGGTGLARGYLNEPELTAEKFIPDPFAEGLWRTLGVQPSLDGDARLYRTGDLARYLPDGTIDFLGRVDNQVKIRGYRVELEEIESVLNGYSGIRESAVVIYSGVPEEPNSGDKRIIAFVVREDYYSIDDENFVGNLREELNIKLPDFMIPAQFIIVETIPLNPNGKIDRKALIRKLSEEGLIETLVQSAYIAPRSTTEEILVEIWQSLLGVKKVGINDNFFQMGGHSLLATQLISRINTIFNIEIPVRMVFESSTIATLADFIDASIGKSTLTKTKVKIDRLQRDESTGALLTPAPLSYAQQRLWFLDQFEPNTPNYNIPTILRIKGDLNIHALKISMTALVIRHEILRTTIQTIDGKPAQIVHPPVNVSIAIEDVSEEEVFQLASEEARRPFDISRLPLFRVKLFRLSDDDYVAVLTMHHIISDGWSTAVMVRELANFYPAYLGKSELGEASAYVDVLSAKTPKLSIQYADFASWQRQWLAGDQLHEQLTYWREQLAGSSPLLELPTDRPRPVVQTSNGNVITFGIDIDLTNKIKKLSKDAGATLFMTLLGAFQVLLMRYSGQVDFCIGTPIANRNHKEIEDLIGFFVNTLVLRSDLEGDPSYLKVIERVKQSALDGYAHQDIPFEMLVNELQPERDTSYSPIFQVMFVLQNLPSVELELPGIKLSSMEISTGISTFDLTLVMEEVGDHLEGGVEYNTDLFDSASIERLTNHFKILLRQLVDYPDRAVTRLPFMLPEEYQKIFLEWNKPISGQLPEVGIHELFEQQVKRSPDEPALVAGERRFTYAQLNEAANQMAHYLLGEGLAPEDLVGLCIERSPEMIIGLLGVLKAGGAYVPLDPTYPKDRLGFMIEDMRARLVLTKEQYSEVFEDFGGRLIKIDKEWPKILLQPIDNPVVESNLPIDPVHKERLAYVIYTSGSTGRPKGVQIQHGAVVNFILWAQRFYKIDQNERVLQFASLNFDTAVEEIFPSLISGALLVLRPEEVLTSFGEFRDLINTYQLTVLDLPTAYWHAWVVELARTGEQIPDCVRLVIVGGEQALLESYRIWKNLFGNRIQWLNTYGPSEATVVCLAFDPHEYYESNEIVLLPIGRPIDNAQAFVVDQNLQLLPAGIPGELVIGGLGLARGYLNQPELSAEKFIQTPVEWQKIFKETIQPSSRLDENQADDTDLLLEPVSLSSHFYRTGDRVRFLADGNIDFLGRIDNQVKLRGMRVELGEIETVLRQNPDIEDAIVLARQEQPGSLRLVAYIIARVENGLEKENVLSFLKDRLPAYMVPSALVIMTAFPLTPNGKIDRRALPVPGMDEVLTSGKQKERQIVPPQTEKESILVEIWKQVLGIDQVSVTDNFFELGGDSILSIQLTARANQAGLQINPRHIFEAQTIAELAELAGTGEVIQAEQGIVTGPLALTPIQRWFFEQNFPNPSHYNQSVMFEVHQQLDPTLLEKTVGILLEHHDSLRLRFSKEQEGWLAEDDGLPEQIPFEHYKIYELIEGALAGDVALYPSGSSLPETDTVIRKLIEEKASNVQASLDIEKSPIIRVVYFDLGHLLPARLLIVIHHLAVDGVSWRILIEDLLSVYQQLALTESIGESQESAIQLPPKTTSYRHWANRLEGYAQSEYNLRFGEIAAELEYWKKVTNEPYDLIIPDFPESKNLESTAVTVRKSLDLEETRQILQDAPSVYKTEINDLLLTALVMGFQKWNAKRNTWNESLDETNLILLLEGHGREDLIPGMDVSRTIGWFTSLYPVKLHYRTSDEIGDTIKSVKEQLRQIPHKGFTFGLLRYLREDTREFLGSQEFTQLTFNYLGQLTKSGQSVSEHIESGFGQDLNQPKIAYDQILKAATESSGPGIDPNAPRMHLIEIDGGVADGRLGLSWTFSQNQFKTETIDKFAEHFIAALRSIIQHCLSPEAGGYTTSDFPLAGIGQSTLDKVLSKVNQPKKQPQ